jgi:tetratricopeptide (TPR) repeat protein
MKLKSILFLIFTSLKLFAQPGDYGYSERQFEELTDKLKKDPHNYELRWKRIALSGFNHTYFDIYEKSGTIKSQVSYFKKPEELLDDLNILINKNVVINEHNVAEFIMIRGRFYYFSGEIDKALNDYLIALDYKGSAPNSDLNDKICISIAAYYYNLKETLTEENARQALKYVNMANPNGCYSNQAPDCYEKEKKELLKFLKEEQRLTTYYKKLILAEYTIFKETKIGGFVTTDYIFNKTIIILAH